MPSSHQNESNAKNSLACFPRVLRIEPASQCNLSCSHCPTGTVDIARGLMTPSTFSHILRSVDQNRDQIKVIVLYHGGEPLLNKNFFSYVASLKSINSNFFIKTVSNGVALTETVSRKLLASDLDQVEFSLDGISAEESEFVRKGSDTEKIIKNIQTLLAFRDSLKTSKLQVAISTTQFHRDLHNAPAVDARTPIWLKRVFEDKVIYKAGYALHWPHMGDSGQYDFLHSTGDDLNECDHVNSTLTVRADGNVVPCCYDLTSKLVMGNVNSESLTQIWTSEKYQALRNSIKSRNFVSICANCATVRPPVYLVPKWSHSSNKKVEFFDKTTPP